MRVLPRTCALVLGAALALAWSPAADAQRGRGSRGHSGSVSKKSESKKKSEDSGRGKASSSPRAPSHTSQPQPSYRSQPQPSYRSQPQPSYRSQSQPSYRPQPQPSYRPQPQPSYRSQPQPSYEARPQPQHAPSYGPQPARPGVVRPETGPARTPPAAAAGGARRFDGRMATTRDPAPIRRLPAVPPTVKRGGTTFTQRAAYQGGHLVVTRQSTPSASTNAPYGQGGGQVDDAHHGGHHGHHHHTTSVRHYHYVYWGWGYYYCYIHTWPYDPWFWGWYWGPFPAPWHYDWWWVGAPWYGYWAWYYSPYAVYVGPSYWVTDYTLARMLEDEYARGWADGRASAEAAAPGTPITEPVKEQIRVQVDEVARTFQESEPLLLEKALENPDYLFIVDTPLSVALDGGGTCSLSGGDIIRRAPTDGASLPVERMTVVTSKSDGCAAGSAVSVSHADLQEMLNTFGQTVDDGLEELQSRQREQGGGEP